MPLIVIGTYQMSYRNMPYVIQKRITGHIIGQQAWETLCKQIFA